MGMNPALLDFGRLLKELVSVSLDLKLSGNHHSLDA